MKSLLRIFPMLLAAVYVCCLPNIAAAEQGLAIIHVGCNAGDVVSKCVVPATAGAPAEGGRYDIPAAGDLVRVCASVANCWGNGEPKAGRFGDLAPSTVIDACDTDLQRGNAKIPTPWTAGADPCKAWKPRTVAEFIPAAGTFSSSVISGATPVSTTLTWDVSDVTSCTASGSWSGAKAVKGTQAIANLTASASYTLTCQRDAQLGSAALSWSNPAQNVDGSALTNLAGVRLVYGTTPSVLNMIIEVPTPASSYTITGLQPATWYFAARAFTTTGLESANSGVASKAVTGTVGKTWTKTVTVTVNPAPTVPNPPSGLTVADPVAYRLEATSDDLRLASVGTVPIGTPCDELTRVRARPLGNPVSIEVNRVAAASVAAAEASALAFARCE